MSIYLASNELLKITRYNFKDAGGVIDSLSADENGHCELSLSEHSHRLELLFYITNQIILYTLASWDP
jgi:hypothetical protein